MVGNAFQNERERESQFQGGPGSVRFGYGLGVERFKRFWFSFPAVPLQIVFFCSVFQHRLTGKDGSGSGFGSWKMGFPLKSGFHLIRVLRFIVCGSQAA